ncbi:MAG TPA: phosphopantothenoylcysteine decarboxylase [Tepidisphaeraceae bacterium]|jgi:phosphopantothenoylcysteine decarboxylase/phosphopantothenate--cysteine ligase
MNILITAGPTREPIDPVRYIGNRSSGRMGAALAAAAIAAGHRVTAILGPVNYHLPETALRIDVETTRQMHDAVLTEFPANDLLIMAAAVADYRPKTIHSQKLARNQSLTLELEPTEDIIAAAIRSKRLNQRTIGFSLEAPGNLTRAREKLDRKHLDLMVYNPIDTMNSLTVEATLLWPDGRSQSLPRLSKEDFAKSLIECAMGVFR